MFLMPDVELIKRNQVGKTVLTVRDFWCNEHNVVSEYLSLSITRFDAYICVEITTTDVHPISYTTLIPRQESIDLSSVRFVKQSIGLTR